MQAPAPRAAPRTAPAPLPLPRRAPAAPRRRAYPPPRAARDDRAGGGATELASASAPPPPPPPSPPDAPGDAPLDAPPAAPAADLPDLPLAARLDPRAAWRRLPGRYRALAATSAAFVVCNMDKVNMSVAVIPMAAEFGWSPTVAGLVQSSFFYGYLLAQLPGGYLVSRVGGRAALPGGVALWSAATAAVPLLAGSLPGLFLSRAAVGLGEGIAPTAATDMVARIVAPGERSRAVAFVFGGLHVGSLLGLLIAPAVIEEFGWPAVFYAFGGIGLAWVAWWERTMAQVAADEPAVAAALAASKLQAAGGGAPVPWRAFLRSGPVRALAYTHFCNNWFHYTMLAWLPTYFSETLNLGLAGAAQVSLLPPIAAIAASALAGPAADGAVARGVPVGTVRKAAQCAAFLGPAACLVGASLADGPLSVGFVSLSLGLASFSLAGLYCNHADLSPRYAPVLLGLTNTCGALPGIVGVAVTGALYDATDSWALSLFAPSIVLFLTGSAVFVAWGSAEAQDFGGAADAPFAVEALWRGGKGE